MGQDSEAKKTVNSTNATLLCADIGLLEMLGQVDKLGCDGTEQGIRSCLHVQLRIKFSTTVFFYL